MNYVSSDSSAEGNQIPQSPWEQQEPLQPLYGLFIIHTLLTHADQWEFVSGHRKSVKISEHRLLNCFRGKFKARLLQYASDNFTIYIKILLKLD